MHSDWLVPSFLFGAGGTKFRWIYYILANMPVRYNGREKYYETLMKNEYYIYIWFSLSIEFASIYFFMMTMTSISIKIQPWYFFFSHCKLQKICTHKFTVASIFIMSMCWWVRYWVLWFLLRTKNKSQQRVSYHHEDWPIL